MYWKSLVLFVSVALVGCSSDSGSDSGSSSAVESVKYSDVAGLWKVEYTDNGKDYVGSMSLTSDGKAVINDLNNVIYGTAKIEQGNLIINGELYDNSVYSATVTGTANAEKMNMTGTSAAGNKNFVMSRTQVEKELYNKGADLASLAGTYSDDPDFAGDTEISGTAVIDSQGNLTFVTTNCQVTGKLSVINSKYNEYNAKLDTSACSTYFTSSIYDGVAVEYKNSNDKRGLFVNAVLKSDSAIWFVGVK